MRVPGVKNLKHGFLYDRVSITSTATEVKAFQTPLGQSNKTHLDTNMKIAGQLEAHQTFWVWLMRFIPAMNAVIADTILILNGSYLEFQIGDAFPMIAPAMLFPGGAGIVGLSQAGDTGTGAFAYNGTTSKEGLFKFARPFKIDPNQTFSVTIKIPTALSGLSASTNVWVVLEGLTKVPVQ